MADDVYDISGTWTFFQGAATGKVDFTLDGNKITGSAESGGVVSNNVTGFVHGESIVFTVPWNNGSKGEYTGVFNLYGRICGWAIDLEHAHSQAVWFSNELFHKKPFK